MDEGDNQVHEDINTYGWHVVKVFDPTSELPNFAYSIGAYHSYQQPEIIMFGLDLDDLHTIINDIVGAMKSGKPIITNNPYEEFLDGYACIFRPVIHKHYDGHFGYALWCYKDSDFPALQCFWPDRNGLYPWEPNCNPAVAQLQPLLYQE
jgi:hypothetical protein